MKAGPFLILLAAAPLAATAQEASPTASPVSSPAAALPATGETPTGSTALAPVLKQEVNLADTGTAESMEIPPPADAPDPRETGEITGKLPGDEPAREAPAVTGTVNVTAKDNGQSVRAPVGHLIRITLESNPSTGYNWELRGFDYGAAELQGSDIVARQSGNVLVGAPADTVITLQAVRPGTQDIELVYRRPWEPADQVAATFRFRLEVPGGAPAPAASPAP